jgi:cytochrome c biogenesis protein CcmG/thiol:disulfide interchange protein DsbE
MRSRRLIAFCGLLFFSVAALALDVGKLAPPYDITLLDGRPFTIEANKGKVVILHFWATWCVPCRKEMPELDRYFRKHHDQGLEMVAISMDDPEDEAKVREAMKTYHFEGALIRQAKMRGYGRIWRIPLTFVIDRKGVLRSDGWFEDSGLDERALDNIVSPLLLDKE